jgi:hypothetical protein
MEGKWRYFALCLWNAAEVAAQQLICDERRMPSMFAKSASVRPIDQSDNHLDLRTARPARQTPWKQDRDEQAHRRLGRER